MPMKKVIFFLLVFAPWSGWGQIVDSIDLSGQTGFDYIDVLGIDLGISEKKSLHGAAPKYVIVVDFGQSMAPGTDNRLKDASGASMTFNSMAGALNAFSKWGWRLVSRYATDSSTGGAIGFRAEHLIMERRNN